MSLPVVFGYTDVNDFICEYEFRGYSKSYVKGLVSELKEMLKTVFKDTRIGFQIFGEKYI